MKFLKDAFEMDFNEKLFVFPSDDNGEINVKTPENQEYLQVHPYALSWVADPARPILLFQNDDRSIAVPIVVSSIGAGTIMAQNSPHLPETNPFSPMVALAESLGARFKECVFTEVKGHYQYAKIVYEHAGHVKDLHLRADEVVIAALSFKIPFYTTAKFVQCSRIMSANMEAMQKDPQMQLQLLNRTHSYLN